MNSNNEERLFTLIKDIYLNASSLKLDIASFITKFFASDVAKNIFDNFDSHYFSSYNIVIDLRSDIKEEENKYNDEFIIYIAYIQIKFFFKTNIDVKKINSYINVEYLEANYELLHTLSDELAIERIIDAYNSKNNAMRKIRSKNNIFNIDDGLDLYIAKSIISSLYPCPNINYLRYEYDGFPFLTDDNHFFVSFIYKGIDKLNDELNKSIYEKYCFKRNGIYVLFVEDNDESLINEISSLIENQTIFETCYVITKRYVLRLKNGLTIKHYYTFSSLDKEYALLDYKCRFISVNKS